MFKKLKLGQKFTILLLAVFLIGILASGSALAAILNYNSRNAVASKALMLIETMNSVRNYTDTQVNPELSDRLEEEFLPETVPAYSAREVFEKLRSNQSYSEFFYKEATLNPTNLRDKADAFEADVVNRFRDNENLQEVKGFRTTPSGDLFYLARPIKISAASCLECHSVPEEAPRSMIDFYGTANGFGWELNEIVGAQMISVPASQVRQNARQSFVLIMGIVMLTFAAAIFMVNLWLKRFVIRPLKRMAMTAEAVSTGDMDADFEYVSNDEVGTLAEAFRRMKMSLMMAMKRLERYRIGRRSLDDANE
ncbi:MAG: c-type heme family protein [Elainellaceae cyanobacterium]